MLIHYDTFDKKWYHSYANKKFTFGKDGNLIPYTKYTQSSIPFDITVHNGNLGPLVGIMTGRKKDFTVAGNGTLFKGLQKELVENGGISVVFTPDDIDEEGVNGYVYEPNKDGWVKVFTPLPHIVYNRIPFRKTEETEEHKNVIRVFKQKGIPFFNPSFLDKYELYSIFKKINRVKNFFPDTLLIQDGFSLKSFLDKHESLYIKPCRSSKGKGVFKIKLESNGTLYYESIENYCHYQSFESFWEAHKQRLLRRAHISQKEIVPYLYNGKRFEFRILAHYVDNKYVVTGVGVRQSQEQNLTTHVPNGGKLIPFEEVKNEKHIKFIHDTVQVCGEILTEKLGFFGEFSIDAGLSDNGDYVIYEINSKPMSFDEEGIEKERILKLTKLFFDLSSFSKK